MQTEKIQARIETYTSSLPQAVQAPHGADFAMLLSLISTNQSNSYSYVPQVAQREGGEGFKLPEETFPTIDELHTPYLVGRLNHSVNYDVPSDFAYINSHLSARADMPRPHRAYADEFAKMALVSSGRLLLDQISQSLTSVPSISAVA
ncbi:hypothetical protein [Neptunomonas antarctica]|uniref:Uncharacterized protein n=1 Tax=Neptunomonas antarctica TaxID=619304 RepID=A0A1N7PAU5_9GAMM|nr:hypothetical protein [Neptunomonas antarctica]SIT07755.1 hypothetical protein SAMN05421760_113104 [Neptunomonas antarctica]